MAKKTLRQANTMLLTLLVGLNPLGPIFSYYMLKAREKEKEPFSIRIYKLAVIALFGWFLIPYKYISSAFYGTKYYITDE